ncbi:Condensin-2 complex subunit D3 [Frankliniella fusca]|uniref:Condensin-2 complex subunit D3 n=1 Tax=Frankliniella fusca TaxID=407009 RepID=A0AAE1LH77_9NEOP|nr:Condensin-2 complex subunit D3 [Frankliniella fusca]
MDTDSISVFDFLRLDLLPEDVVNAQWREGYFNEDPEISAELELHLDAGNTSDILLSLSREFFLKAQNLTPWPDIIQEGFNFKKILYLIYYLLCRGVSRIEEEQSRTYGLVASRVYFSFLAVPGGGSFLIYQSNLYHKALRMLQCGYLMKMPEVQSPLKGRGRGSRQSSDDVQSPLSPCHPLPRHEIDSLRRLLVDTALDLIKVLLVSELGREGDAIPLTVEALSNIATLEIMRPDMLSRGAIEPSSTSLAMNAFYGLLTCCSEKHGEVQETVRLIMRFSLEALVMGFKKEAKALPSSQINAVRDVFTDFVHHVCLTAGDAAYNGVFILLQHLCMCAPDRAEFRTKLVESTVILILKLPKSFLYKACSIIIVMSCHDKASVRLFSVEVTGRILSTFKVQFSNDKPEELDYKLHKLLFAAMLARIQDMSALVRSRAMSRLVSYLKESSGNEGSKYLVSELFVQPYLDKSLQESSRKKFKNFNEIAKTLQSQVTLTDVYIPCAQSIMQELTEFCDDHKVMVRKAALQFLLRILYLNVKFMDVRLLTEISAHCRDEAVLVRKMMVQEFTDLLLMYPSHQQLLRQWTLDIVPSIFDSEITVVEKVLESFERAILDNMVKESQMHHLRHQLPWIIMNQISHLQLRKAFLKACSMWKEENLRSRLIIPILKSHIGMGKPYNESAWVTLMCLAEFMSIKDPGFILEFYHDEIYGVPNVSTYISQLVMEVMWLTWRQLPASDKSSLAYELNTDLLLFKVPVPLISRAVDIRYGLHVSSKEGIDVSNPPDWATDLIKKCEESIFETLILNPDQVQDEEAMKRFVITLGNVCLYYPRIVGSRTTSQLLHMLSSPQEGKWACQVNEFWRGSCGVELKAGLVVTLGKIGLQNESFAKKLIDILSDILSLTKESALKNNIIICLTDLCIRHTSLGDELLPDMCVCLKDTLQPVRQNTLKLLIQLVQEDYIKMRDNLTFHFLSMLNDDDYTIVTMTRVFFVDTVLRKKGNCFTTSFIASILHFNGYEFHHRSTKVSLTKREKEVFDISGVVNREKRRNIYRFMLSHSSDEDRFTISGHLIIEICKGVLDGKIKLDGNGEDVLKDCLYVMDCDEIHITDNKDAEDDDDAPADEEDACELVLNFAHKKLFSEAMTFFNGNIGVILQLVKKRLIETDIPILAKLKRKLAVTHLGLAADVTRVLKTMVKDYKIDPADLKDPLLVQELNKKTSSSNSSGGSSSDEDSN